MNEINPELIKIQRNLSQDSQIKPQKSSALPNGGFDKILNGQFEKNITPNDTKKTETLPELQGSFRAQTLNLKFNQAQFTSKFEDSLNLLESYAEWLDDPKKSLKQTHGLLEQILDQTRMLEQEFESGKSVHPDLAQILSQLKTTVQIEQIKFNRGDYS